MTAITWPLLLFEQGTKIGPDRKNQTITTVTPEKTRVYRCSACSHLICDEGSRQNLGERSERTFFNPNGIVFQIGCFNEAPGSRCEGLKSDDFSWFPGYQWQITVCNNCFRHLGWHFSGGGSPFFGLILPKLVLTEE